MDGTQCLPEPIKTSATGTVELHVSADGKKVAYKITVNKLLNPSQADLHLGGRVAEWPARRQACGPWAVRPPGAVNSPACWRKARSTRATFMVR
jgi:hypothetical protein